MGDTQRAPNGGTEASALELYAETVAELLDTETASPATDLAVIMRAKREAADSIRDYLAAADQARQAERCRVIAFGLYSTRKDSALYKQAEERYKARHGEAQGRLETLATEAVQTAIDDLKALDAMEHAISARDT